MRLTQALTWFGIELSWDFYLGPSTVDDDVLDSVQDAPDTSPGSFTSCPVGFTASLQPEWEVPGSYHQFDPEPDGED